ncbi:hypothetical protein A6E15_04675 [Natrinema saccharevitans]|uniref:RCK C-terminal domain-containing protein n=1 Tax=Natrinema saccharevitans TaxID=301967 RepID=A0A1S8AUC6_9EURY|nr:hypothetical protein [Natrinema saccharevitans]OLZ40320.1 hypothetical protein A6E15_04675 [Natrinema saccharevitans]
MIEITTELVVGVAFGFVVGVGPAIAVGVLAAGISIRGRHLSLPLGVAVAGGLAGCNGYLVGLFEGGMGPLRVPRIGAAALVVALLAVFAASQGERVASELPIGTDRPTVRTRSLSAAAIDAVDAMGQVQIRTTGDVRDIDGYPPLSPDVRAAIEADAWRLPADLPLSALESRLATRLRTEYDLTAASVSVDGRGRATVAAAPPTDGDAASVPDGWRAVSVSGPSPPGLEPGTTVEVSARDASTAGTVLSVDRDARSERVAGADDSVDKYGAVTLAVPATDAAPLLAADRVRIAVPAAGHDPEREAIARLERAGYVVRHVSGGAIASTLEAAETDDPIHPVVASSPADADVIETAGAKPVADRNRWQLDPDPEGLEKRESVFVAGEKVTLQRCIGDARDSRPPPPVETATEVSP